MDDLSGPRGAGVRGQKLLVGLGSAGMLLAMGTDAVAVLGRHIGFSLVGSIEIFQVAAVAAISASVLLCSILNRHATVDLLIGRLSDRNRHRLAVIGNATLVLTFGLVAAGSSWVAIELWPTTERTELLSIPIAPFRFLWIASCTLASIYFLVQFIRGMRR